MRKLIPSVLITLGLIASSISSHGADLSIELSELRNTQGSIQFAIYDNEKDFQQDASENVFMSFSSQVTGETMKYTVHGIPKGNYAVTVIHDENNNLELNMDGRTPLEGLAFSSTKSRFTKPSFDRAATKIAQENKSIEIKLNYYNH